ncbi:MAG: hypothetical protein H7A33_03790 [Deltaproteobacteria bacterium]|nr:hypothetical protein [Deltaproteobacteria bacterium]
MPQDLSYTNSSNTIDFEQTPNQPKSKKGCGCFLISFVGCASLFILGIAILAALGSAFNAIDKENVGEIVLKTLLNEKFSKGIIQGINDSPNINEQDKKNLIQLIKQVQTIYPNLPQDQKDQLEKNLVLVGLALAQDPHGFESNPPQEFLEILQLIKLINPSKQSIGRTPKPNFGHSSSFAPTQINDESVPANNKPEDYDF